MKREEAIKDLDIIRFNPHWDELVNEEYWQELMEMATKALEEVQQYRAIGSPEECRTAIEKQKKGLSVDEAKRIAAKAICIGCGYLTGYECSYKGGNCMTSKPMLESVLKSFDDWNRRANDETD